ncbi:MAG: hypothetical protein ACLR8L_00080 [Oscillospiraceae bacterium]
MRNNQQDYLNRIPSLANDALVYLATQPRGGSGRWRICQTRSRWGIGLCIRCRAISGQLCPSGIIYVDNHGNVSRTSRYKLMGENKHRRAEAHSGSIKAEYFPLSQRCFQERTGGFGFHRLL